MPTSSQWRRLTCAAALATACSATAASTAAALNPQPLPPRISGERYVSQQSLSSNWQISWLNPQPEPPGRG